jgi:hypothetical protein
MSHKLFKKALYYMVREGFNADHFPGFIETRWDSLIRRAIRYFKNTDPKKLPAISRIEIIELIRAEKRREQTLQ